MTHRVVTEGVVIGAAVGMLSVYVVVSLYPDIPFWRFIVWSLVASVAGNGLAFSALQWWRTR